MDGVKSTFFLAVLKFSSGSFGKFYGKSAVPEHVIPGITVETTHECERVMFMDFVFGSLVLWLLSRSVITPLCGIIDSYGVIALESDILYCPVYNIDRTGFLIQMRRRLKLPV